MTQKDLNTLVSTIANKFSQCDDAKARRRGAEAVLHLIMACKGNDKMYQAILDMVDSFYSCYYYGYGLKETTSQDWVQEWNNTKHGEFLVKYCKKIAYGLCAEDASIIEDYINEIIEYKNNNNN